MTEAILVVEDDDETRNMLVRHLRREGFQVLAARDGDEGMAAIVRHRPVVVVLDLVMPGMPGQLICKNVRGNPETADIYILMLTGLAQDGDRISGFELGADDYVTKPFNMRELVLRVTAGFKRVIGNRGIREGSLRVDADSRRAWIGEQELALTATEFDLLLCFMLRPGKLFTREEILRECWQEETRPDARCVDAHIKRLRQKLGAAAAAIQTVHGSGYRYSIEELMAARGGPPASRDELGH
ncbi:MAG: response regulator transcription factor [Vicinamibacteria bacterium]|jgi:two-component system phosphate regulon response regulator PhoB|nr:response regulator transcription factor [Vicinamibacteria bacterium]